MKKFIVVILTLLMLIPLQSPVALADISDGKDPSRNLKYEENSCLALNYHRIRDFNTFEKMMRFLSNSKELKLYSVSTEEFENQMKWLKDNDADFLDMEEFIEAYETENFPEKCVWVNFDDIDQSVFDNAHPILEKYDIPATAFIITGEVGNKNFNNLKLLSEKNLKKLDDSGLWTFGSHTSKLHHLNDNISLLTTKSKKEIEDDLSDSISYLKEQNFGFSDIIAYPYGQANGTVNDAMESVGIKYGFTLEEDIVTPKSNPYYIPRILVNDESFDSLVKEWRGFK